MLMPLRVLASALILFGAAHGNPARAAPAKGSKATRPIQHDELEMKAIFDADQADRAHIGKIDWSSVGPRDEARRARTKALVDGGKLHSSNDFYRAAFVFQHGSKSDDFLLAHTFALAAAALGRRDAAWIAAATLDRYLQRIGQKQIYGTQFTNHNNGPWSQEPYDRTLVSDALRRAVGVPPLEDQERQRQWLEAQIKSETATER